MIDGPDHPYRTTWTTPTNPDGPLAGELGPDLDKPCLDCGGEWRGHLRMSLVEYRSPKPERKAKA